MNKTSYCDIKLNLCKNYENIKYVIIENLLKLFVYIYNKININLKINTN